MFRRFSIVAAGLLAMTAVQGQAQNAQRQAERELFAKIVEIPTVEGHTAEFKKLNKKINTEIIDLPFVETVETHALHEKRETGLPA